MIRNELWIITTLLAVGTIGGLVYNWPSGSRSAQKTPVPVSEKTQNESDGTQNASVESLPPREWYKSIAETPSSDLADKGDNYLEAGNFKAAVQYYMAAADKLGDTPGLLLRLGISNELAGRYNHAEREYRAAIRTAEKIPVVRMFALIGQARIWQLKGNYAEASELLYELYLRHADDLTLPEPIRLQLEYQLAETLRLTIGPVDRIEDTIWLAPEDRVFAQLAYHQVEPDFSLMFEIVDEASSPKTPNVELLPLVVRQRPGFDASLIMISANTTSLQIKDVLAQIEKESELAIRVSKLANKHLRGRSTKIVTEVMPLSLLLDGILSPYHLVWQQEEEEIRIVHTSEVNNDILRRYRIENAIRILRRVTMRYESGEQRSASMLSLGNLRMLRGEIDEAATQLDQLYEESPVGEIKAKMFFNSGVLDFRLERNTRAVALLEDALYQSMDSHLRSICLEMMGTIALSENQIELATKNSSRCLTLASDRYIRRQASLDLARAYLLQNEYVLANQALYDHRDAYDNGNEFRLATVYGAYCRTMGTHASIIQKSATERLVIGLTDLSLATLTTPADKILISRAYAEIQMHDRAIDILKNAYEETMDAVWRRKIAADLAYRLRDIGAHNDSLDVFKDLAKGKDLTSTEASYQIAKLYLETDRPAESLVIAKKLWVRVPENLKRRTLHLMGRAYQQLDQPRRAAICFSGLLPNDVAGLPQETKQ